MHVLIWDSLRARGKGLLHTNVENVCIKICTRYMQTVIRIIILNIDFKKLTIIKHSFLLRCMHVISHENMSLKEYNMYMYFFNKIWVFFLLSFNLFRNHAFVSHQAFAEIYNAVFLENTSLGQQFSNWLKTYGRSNSLMCLNWSLLF